MRQALSYGIQRSQLQKVLGGPIVNPALTHVLPAGIDGSQGVPANYNPYAYNPYAQVQTRASRLAVARRKRNNGITSFSLGVFRS